MIPQPPGAGDEQGSVADATCPLWIRSPIFDFSAFVGPGLLSLILAILVLPWLPAYELGDWDWLVLIVAVDVAHVYSTLFRSYFDAGARRRYGWRFWLLPLGLWGLGTCLHFVEAALFWRSMAYLAVFHFIRQHEGFYAIFARKAGETKQQIQAGKLLIWATTAGPVIWWHTRLPREFSWFMAGDFISGVPQLVGDIALLAQLPALALFTWRQLPPTEPNARHHRHPLSPWLAIVPGLNWNLGIVVVNHDTVFSITNILMHGLPYLALVWVSSRVGTGHGQSRASGARAELRVAAVCYALILGFAVGEELLWDWLRWHDHSAIFGSAPGVLQGLVDVKGFLAAGIVALLSVPQLTHYCLDGWLWRANPRNPELARRLGLRR